MKLFPIRHKVTNPYLIAVNYNKLGNPKFEAEQKEGVFFRVIPDGIKEINALKILEHRLDKFAPATGDGVLITANAMRMLDA